MTAILVFSVCNAGFEPVILASFFANRFFNLIEFMINPIESIIDFIESIFDPCQPVFEACYFFGRSRRRFFRDIRSL